MDPAVVSLVTTALGAAVGVEFIRDAFIDWLRGRPRETSTDDSSREADLDPELAAVLSRISESDREVALLLQEDMNSTTGALEVASVASALASESRQVSDAEDGTAVVDRLLEVSRDLTDLAPDDELLSIYAESIAEYYPWANSGSVSIAAEWSAIRFDQVSRGLRLDARSREEGAQFLNDLLGAEPPAIVMPEEQLVTRLS